MAVVQGHRGKPIEVVSTWLEDRERSALELALGGRWPEGLYRLLPVADARHALRETDPDLVVLDGDRDDLDVCTLIRDIRWARLCPNPFVVIVVLVSERDPQHIRQIVDSGADDILFKPVSAEVLAQRIEALTYCRRPFVVTADYLGPDRRRDPGRAASATVPRLEVPNSLRTKAEGLTDGDLPIQVSQVLADIREQRIRRDAFQVGFLVVLLRDPEEGSDAAKTRRTHLARLFLVVEDMLSRIGATQYEDVVPTCWNILELVGSLRAQDGALDAAALDRLTSLSENLLVRLHPDRLPQELALDIAATLARYRAHQSPGRMGL